MLNAAPLLAINPSECHASTNFLEGDFWTGIASECPAIQLQSQRMAGPVTSKQGIIAQCAMSLREGHRLACRNVSCRQAGGLSS